MVQNRVSLAMYQLPTSVQNQGILIRKKTPDILMVVNFFSPHGLHDDIYLSNYATINVKDELLRIYGVSDITYLGQRDYSIRAWLDPQKLASLNMTANDVANAVLSQNLDAPAGQVGQPPASRTQSVQLPIDTIGRLTTPEQFGDIVIKTALGQQPPRASVTAPSSSSSSSGSYGLPTPPGANPLLPPGSPTSPGGGNSTGSMAGAALATLPSASFASPVSSAMLPAAGAGATVSTGATTTSLAGGSSAGGTMGGAQSGGGASTAGGAQSGGGATNSVTSPASLSNLVLTNSTAGVSSTVTPTGGTTGPTVPTASIVRLRDVARVELGAQAYTQACTFDQHPSVGLAIWQLPGTNALDVANRVKAKMEELKELFPFDVDYDVGYDTTPFISESIEDVVHTLLEAVALVGVVVLLFLQDWRAMILPMIDVPVSIIGTFAVMAVLGFSLNNISLFGLVLAIGIVVDDAIVVLGKHRAA